MKKKSLLYIIIIIIVTGVAFVGFISYNNTSFKGINVNEIKSVKFLPFQGPLPKKEYIYETKNAEDIEVINKIINYLNSGKPKGRTLLPVSQGGTPPELDLTMTNGKVIGISIMNARKDEVLITDSSTNKTFKFYSPELRKLFNDEYERIFIKKAI